MSNTLNARLEVLQASYVVLVNNAVAADDYALADELAAAYDRDVDSLHAEELTAAA